MLESAGVLESIAEVGIALAGFGGIAAGLGYRTRGTWTLDDQARISLLAFAGLAVVFACYLPHVTHHLGSTAPWRMASILFLPYPAFWLIRVASFNRGGVPAGFSRIAAWLVFISLIATSTLLLAAGLGFAGSRVFGLYVCAVLLTLFQASVYFVRLLATSFRTGEPERSG